MDTSVKQSPLEVLSMTGLPFEIAKKRMQEGKKCARKGWNGKGMWVCLGAGNTALPAESFWNKHTRKFAEENGGTAEVAPYFLIKTADNKIQMGWHPSQPDLLAEDWEELPD